MEGELFPSDARDGATPGTGATVASVPGAQGSDANEVLSSVQSKIYENY